MCRLCKIRSIDTPESPLPYWIISLTDNQDIMAAQEIIIIGGYQNLKFEDSYIIGRIFFFLNEARNIVNLINDRACQHRKHSSGRIQPIEEFLETHKNNTARKNKRGLTN